MTDRELLEFAAKAYGGFYSNGALWIGREVIEYEWEPQNNDGQALRLAVKCDLLRFTEIYEAPLFSKNGENEFSATRKAIVSIAAEIGKSIK